MLFLKAVQVPPFKHGDVIQGAKTNKNILICKRDIVCNTSLAFIECQSVLQRYVAVSISSHGHRHCKFFLVFKAYAHKQSVKVDFTANHFLANTCIKSYRIGSYLQGSLQGSHMIECCCRKQCNFRYFRTEVSNTGLLK